MYNQTYDDEAPIPLTANYTVVKEAEEEKRESEERVILEIGRQDERPKEEHTFSHKKYDKTISHHRSYVLDDYSEPRRITYFRPHEQDHPHEGKWNRRHSSISRAIFEYSFSHVDGGTYLNFNEFSFASWSYSQGFRKAFILNRYLLNKYVTSSLNVRRLTTYSFILCKKNAQLLSKQDLRINKCRLLFYCGFGYGSFNTALGSFAFGWSESNFLFFTVSCITYCCTNTFPKKSQQKHLPFKHFLRHLNAR